MGAIVPFKYGQVETPDFKDGMRFIVNGLIMIQDKPIETGRKFTIGDVDAWKRTLSIVVDGEPTLAFANVSFDDLLAWIEKEQVATLDEGNGDTGSGERTLSKGQVFECIKNCKNIANKIIIRKGDRVTIDGTSNATYAVRIGDVATEIYKRPFNSWVDTKHLILVNKPDDPLLGKRFKVAKNCKARNGVNDRVIFKKGDIIVISCETMKLDGYYDVMINYGKYNAITQDFIRRCIEEGKLEDCTRGSLPEGEKKFEVLSPCVGVNKFTIFDTGSILVVRKDGPDHYSVFETAHGWRTISKKFFDECVEDEKIREVK